MAGRAMLWVGVALLLFTGVAFGDQRLVLRDFRVPAGFVQVPFERCGSSQQQLCNKGLKFMPGTFATYYPKTRELIIFNTGDQVELLDELITAGTHPTIQVKVSTVFVEIKH